MKQTKAIAEYKLSVMSQDLSKELSDILLFEEGDKDDNGTIITKNTLLNMFKVSEFSNINYRLGGTLIDKNEESILDRYIDFTFTVDNYRLVEEDDKYKVYVDIYTAMPSYHKLIFDFLRKYQSYGFKIELTPLFQIFDDNGDDKLHIMDISNIHILDNDIVNKIKIHERKLKIDKILENDLEYEIDNKDNKDNRV